MYMHCIRSYHKIGFFYYSANFSETLDFCFRRKFHYQKFTIYLHIILCVTLHHNSIGCSMHRLLGYCVIVIASLMLLLQVTMKLNMYCASVSMNFYKVAIYYYIPQLHMYIYSYFTDTLYVAIMLIHYMLLSIYVAAIKQVR